MLKAGLRHETAASPMSDDEAVVDEADESLPDSHSADSEFLGELNFRRDGITWLELARADAVPEVVLDAQIVRGGTTSAGHAWPPDSASVLSRQMTVNLIPARRVFTEVMPY